MVIKFDYPCTIKNSNSIGDKYFNTVLIGMNILIPHQFKIIIHQLIMNHIISFIAVTNDHIPSVAICY